MRRTTSRVLAAIAALSAFAATVLTSNFVFLLIALLALLVLASSFSNAGHLAEELQRFRNQAVEVRVWGVPLPVPAGDTLTVSSAMALSAGLHIFLRVGGSGSTKHLKVAQPGGARLDEPRAVVIETARYVQWSGRRMSRVATAPAVTVSLSERSR